MINNSEKMVYQGKTYKVDKYSVWAEEQMLNKYGDKLTEKFLAPQNEIILSEVIYLLSEELKADFPTLESFKKSIITIDDKYAVVTTAWAVITPAITIKRTDEEIEEEALNKKKIIKKWNFGNFLKSLFSGLIKLSAGKTVIQKP